MSANTYRTYLASVVIACISPWFLVYEFARTSSWKYRHWLITLFFAFFGSVVLLWSGDGYVHQQTVLTEYMSMSLEAFVADLWNVLTFQHTESGAKDVYKHVLSFLVGSMLGMPGLFFPIVATVYGYFFGGSVLLILRNFRLSQTNYVVLAVVLVFLFIRGLEGFYTVRTWTGMWILVYSCLKFHETKRVKYALLMLTPPLVHIGFFVLAIPAWIVMVAGSRPMIYSAIFIASSVTTILPVDDATAVLSSTERGASQVNAYLVEERKVALEEFDRMRGETNWYNAYRRAGVQRWAPTVLAYVLLLSGVYLHKMTRYQQRVFSIGLLTLALSNATWFLFAVHNRALIVGIVFVLAGYLLARLDPQTGPHLRDLGGYYRWGVHLSIALFVPLVLFNMSMTLDWMSVFMFGLPFVVWLDPELNMSVKEFLRALITAG